MNRSWYKNIIYYILLLCTLPTLNGNDDNNYDKYLYDLDSIEQDFGTLEVGEITRNFSPQDCVDQLVNVLHAQIILQEDVYKHTNPINSRPLHDFPEIYIDTYYHPECAWQFSLHPFYFFTWRGNFTNDSQFIRSYIALVNPNIIQELDDIIKDQLDLAEVLALFESLKLHERRAGFMLGGEKHWNGWTFRVKAPILYLERNLFLNESEREAIEDAEIFDDNDPSTDLEKQQRLFARKHLIADKVGLGDTRFRFGYDIVNKPEYFVTLGGEITLPTAFAFAKGLYGSHFSKTKQAPNFSIFDTFQLIFCPDPDLEQAKENVEGFLLAALDRLSAILLESKLGNGGHIGLAGYFRSDLEVTNCFRLASYGALEYLLPASEQRFYIQKKTQAEFINRDYNDPNLASANLEFLNQQLINTLFPSMYDTIIFPGLVFKFGGWMNLHAKCIDFTLGYDVWWQGQETLGSIKAPKMVKDTLRTSIAQKPGAMQNKIFAGINYTHTRCDHEWCLGVFGDVTFLQFGLGNDFGISIKYEQSI